MTFFDGVLYLVGYCHLRRDVRIFAVDRIRALSGTTFGLGRSYLEGTGMP